LKVIAFFDLHDGTDPEEFLEWVKRDQKTVFEKRFRSVKDFRVYRTIDSDNGIKLPQMVQIFDYSGSADDWRKTLDYIRRTDDRELSGIVDKWLGYCQDKSTKIIYASEGSSGELFIKSDMEEL
jgi:hypothetical protein